MKDHPSDDRPNQSTPTTITEARIREGMRMMALSDSALYASWAFHFATTFTIIAGLIVVRTTAPLTYTVRSPRRLIWYPNPRQNKQINQ